MMAKIAIIIRWRQRPSFDILSISNLQPGKRDRGLDHPFLPSRPPPPCCRQLVRLDGQWYSLPLDRARPMEPFKRLFSDRVETAEFEERLFGGRIGWSPRVNKPRKVRGHAV